MAWSEITGRRVKYGRHYQDGLKRRFETVLGTPLHYGTPGSLEPVDFRPERINNAALDGWRVTTADWHYAIGQPGDKDDDGWVGFGGDAGAYWFLFRLASAGHLHWPTKNYTQLASASYDRADLGITNIPLALADGQDVAFPDARVEWENVFPGVDLRWDADGRRLKEEIVVSDAARAVWADPATPENETYATFIFELDTIGIPEWAVDGLPQLIEDGFSDQDGNIEMRGDIQELIAFMPIDFAFIEGAGPDDPRVRVRKRMFRQDGTDYLAIGIKVSELNALPAGTVIFDPTLDLQPGSAGGKDSNIRKDNASTNYGSNALAYFHYDTPYDRKMVIEFDLTSLSSAYTCDAATLYLTSNTSYAWDTNETLTVYSLASGVDTWVESEITYNVYKSGTNWPGSAGANTAGTDYESGSMGSAVGPGGSGQGSISLSASRVEGWFGSPNTNYGMIIVIDSGWASVHTSDATSSSDRPKLSVDYTEGPADPAAAGTVTVSDEQTIVSGAETAVGSILVASVPPTTLNTRGNLFWNTHGPQLSAMLFVCQGDDWVQMDGGGTPAAAQHGFEVERIKAYLVPQ